MSKATVSKFIKQTIALITGDDAEKTAVRIERKASVALKSELTLQEQEVVNFQEQLIDAEEAITAALSNNGDLITDSERYMERLIQLKEKAIQIEGEIENRELIVSYLQELQSRLN